MWERFVLDTGLMHEQPVIIVEGERISAKVPAFRNQLVRAGTRVEFGIRRANYTFGYFVVLPAYGLRNDRLFINDLSLGTSWAITGDSSEVPHSDLVIEALNSPVLFLSAEGP
ncbi:hypothetical protein ALC56_06073 [Trachymyrmex septentrionalis]|uniref:Uncharacterized protein n=1 Tax=Trachymyrmex septentrionalis TaxID=34720 RepID=A0A195FHW2_9HYME|nr:hypothetical protein ALC56_06073 [Trachymyrmex septentrionalis]